jgi:WD40 repeat protein
MDGPTFWSAVGAVGTCVAAVVALLAYRNSRHSSKPGVFGSHGPERAGHAWLVLALAVLVPGAAHGHPPAPTDSSGDPLPPGALARLGTSRLRHGDTVGSLAFSPDGRWLASAGGYDGSASLWDARTGQERHRLGTHDGQVYCVAWSPDGRRLATGGTGPWLRLWDVASGREVGRLPTHDSWIKAIAFFPDARRVACGGGDTVIHLLEVTTGRLLTDLRGHTNRINDLALSADGKVLASAGEDHTLRLWDVQLGKQVRQLQGTSSFDALAFSPDGRNLAWVPYRDSVVHLAQVGTGNEVAAFHASRAPVEAVRFSPDGKTLAAAGSGTIWRWDLATGRQQSPIASPHDHFCALAFSPDSKTLAGGSRAHAIRMWDLTKGKPLHRCAGHHGGNVSVSLLMDRRTLASLSQGDRTVRFWDLRTGREMSQCTCADGEMTSVVLSPDGRTLALGDFRGRIALWDCAADRLLCQLGPQKGQISGLAFSPDSKTLLSAAQVPPQGHEASPHTLCQWDVGTGRRLRALGPHDGAFVGLAFSPDGRTVVVGASLAAKGVRLWDLHTGQERVLPCVQGGGPVACAFSGNGQILAASSGKDARTIQFWEVVTGGRIGQLQGATDFLSCVAFSPDGRTLAAGGFDQAVRLWDVASGATRARLRGHRGEVVSLVFSADGARLISGSSDTTALVWDVSKLVERAPPAQRVFSAAEQEALWGDLAGRDASRAYRAVWILMRSPDQSIPLIEGRLRPLRTPDPLRIAELIAQLDADGFAVREKASQELEELEWTAAPALRRALQENPPLEPRRRLEKLLERLGDPSRSPSQLRSHRAIAVLEGMASPDSRRLLSAVAGGASEALRTRLAKDALRRVGQ